MSLVQHLLAAERRAAGTRRSFRIALVVSLALHALVLFFPLLLSQPLGGKDDARYRVNVPLQARLHQRSQVASSPRPEATPRQEARKKTRPELLSSKQGQWSARSRPAERPPVSGAELAQRALAMARGMGRTEEDGGEDEFSTKQEEKGKEIEPLSLQWYFDSFITKLNRSSRFVPRATGPKGQRAAEVEIVINRDGSLRDYRVVRAADRQVEVDYIRAVVERASPFSAFPPDIGQKKETLSLTICIQPPGEAGGGFGFTRTSGKRC